MMLHQRRRPEARTTTAGNERLRQIVDQAVRLFERDGYHRVTMDDIADAVGLRKPSLYHYVKNKDEILALIHREFMQLVFNQREGIAEADVSARDDLVGVIASIMDLMDSRRGYVRVFFEHYRELPEEDKKTIASERDQYGTVVEEIIARGVKSGEFRLVDVRMTTFAVFGMCNWAYQWYRPGGERSAREIAGTFADLILNGISAIPR